MIMASVLVIWLAVSHKEEINDEGQQETTKLEETVDNTIEIWYAYKGYDKYLEYAIKDYIQNQNKDITIELKYIGEPGYFDYINAQSLDGKGPDLFIMGSEYMEKAYLLGILEDNYNSEIYNTNNYPQIALDAATYSGRLVGYPMGFDTSAMLANNKYVSEKITTFVKLKIFADTFGKTEEEDGESNAGENQTVDISNISAIISWDVNKLLMNYGFIGKYIKFSNEKSKEVDMNNSSVITAAKDYILLKDYFSLTGEDDYETVKSKFYNQEIVFAIVGTDILKINHNSDIQYTISEIPNLTDSIECTSLSYTDILAVNHKGNNKEIATSLAEYLSYTFAENMHTYSGIISCRDSIEYADNRIDEFLKIYAQSVSMPNMMETEDYNIIMEESLKAIWNGADVMEMFNSLQKKYSERFR